MKFWNAKEIRVIFFILATGYFWMLTSCAQENHGTKVRRGQTFAARKATQKISDNKNPDVQANQKKSVVNSDSNEANLNQEDSKNQSDDNQKENLSNNTQVLKISDDVQLNLSLNVNCGDSHNILCQEDSDFQKSFVSKVQGTKKWVSAENENGHYEFSQIQGLTATLSDLMKGRITFLKNSQANDILKIKPILKIDISQEDGKALHCQLMDDLTLASPSAAEEKFALNTAQSVDSQSMVHTTNDTFVQAANNTKNMYFSLKHLTQTLTCEATGVGDLSNSENLKSYQKLVLNVMSLTFVENENARKPASFEQALSGELNHRHWEVKSARITRVTNDENSFLVLDLFNKNIDMDHICESTQIRDISKIEVKIPLRIKEVHSRQEIVPVTEDAEVMTSRRSISSKDLYFELRLNSVDLNDSSRNNVRGTLELQNSHGTDMMGAFAARVCPN